MEVPVLKIIRLFCMLVAKSVPLKTLFPLAEIMLIEFFPILTILFEGAFLTDNQNIGIRVPIADERLDTHFR